jgi:hypothetical protein
MSENEYSLGKSKKALGPLYPILKAKDGSIIDGFHRQNDDPDWATLTVPQIDTPVKLELARLATNFCRRKMPLTEIENRIAFLVKNGLKPVEIAEQTGISESTVYKYMPQELKVAGKVEAGRVGGSAPRSEQTVSTRDVGQPIRVMSSANLLECDGCKMATHITKLATLNEEDLCPICYQRRLKFPKAELKSPEPNSKPVESWEQRKAVMSPGVSKMDEAVFSALQTDKTLRDSGWHFKFQEHYCIKEVVSDVTAMKGDVEKPLFLDGDVHFGKEDRDEANRDLLRRRLGISDVLAFAYTGAYSEVKRDEIVTKIRESLKF